jgi:hypothetical protein
MVVGKTDPAMHRIQVLVAKDERGQVQWVIWQWPCHATSFHDASAVSADFPGVVREQLRRTLGDSNLPVLFLPGVSGDIRPDITLLPVALRDFVSYPLQRPFATPGKSGFETLCRSLMTAVSLALRNIQEIKAPEKLKCRKITCNIAEILVSPQHGSQPAELDIIALDGGDFGIILVSAEMTSHYRDACNGLAEDKWLISGCCNQVFGYLPSARQIAEGGYEADGFIPYFSLQGRFASGVEQNVRTAIRSVLDDSG